MAIISAFVVFGSAKAASRSRKRGPVYSYRPEAMWRYYVVNYYMHDRLRLFDVDMPEKGLLLVGEGDFQILKDGVGADYKFSDTKLLGCRSNETRQHTLLLEFERKHCAL